MTWTVLIQVIANQILLWSTYYPSIIESKNMGYPSRTQNQFMHYKKIHKAMCRELFFISKCSEAFKLKQQQQKTCTSLQVLDSPKNLFEQNSLQTDNHTTFVNWRPKKWSSIHKINLAKKSNMYCHNFNITITM